MSVGSKSACYCERIFLLGSPFVRGSDGETHALWLSNGVDWRTLPRTIDRECLPVKMALLLPQMTTKTIDLPRRLPGRRKRPLLWAQPCSDAPLYRVSWPCLRLHQSQCRVECGRTESEVCLLRAQSRRLTARFHGPLCSSRQTARAGRGLQGCCLRRTVLLEAGLDGTGGALGLLGRLLIRALLPHYRAYEPAAGRPQAAPLLENDRWRGLVAHYGAAG